MLNPQILEYVSSARQKKIPDQTIKAQLLSAGWPEADVQQALFQTPQALNNQTKSPISNVSTLLNRKLLLIVSGVIVLLVILAISAVFLLNSKKTTKEATSKTTTNETKSSHKQTLLFDMPKLLNKSKEELKSIFGKPSYEKEGYISFEKEDWSFTSYYDYDNPTKFRFISASVPQIDENDIIDQTTIFKTLNIAENSKDYILKIHRNMDNEKMILSVDLYPPDSTDFSLKD